MKARIEIKQSKFEVDEVNERIVWIIELDNEEAEAIAQGAGETPGQAFENALMKLSFELAEK